MTHHRLSDMVKGWFVGAFAPTAFSTDTCEVAIKRYAAGAMEARHFHKVATEITVVVSGSVVMCEREWGPGDIVVLAPGEVTGFHARTDSVTVVVKLPGARDDKYVVDAAG